MLPTWIFEAKARHDALLEQEVGRVAFFVVSDTKTSANWGQFTY